MIGDDSGRAKAMVADLRTDAGRYTVPADHPPGGPGRVMEVIDVVWASNASGTTSPAVRRH
jgi:hypothetical protein